MTLFVFLNWLLYFITLFVILTVIIRYRYLFIKPSMIVIFFFHIMIQVGATIKAGYIESYLPEPYIFLVLVHGFPLIGIAFTLFTGNQLTLKIFDRVTADQTLPFEIRIKSIIILSGFIIFFFAYYFTIVPLHKTGLYAIFIDPTNSAWAREFSLKLVDNPIVRYGYHFISSAIAPMLAVILILAMTKISRWKRLALDMGCISGIVLLILIVSITGARSYAASLILTIVLCLLLRRGLPLNPLYIIITFVLVLSIPAVISLLREGRILQFIDIQNYIFGPISRRVFIDPMMGGAYRAHYAQTFGFFGIAGIPKLAVLFGVEPVNVSNIIGLAYESSYISTVSSNACYVFSYYGYFGLFSIPLTIILLWFLDSILYVYRELSNAFLIPCISTVSVNFLSLISSDYTTALLTHGILVSLFIAIIVDTIINFKTLSVNFNEIKS